MQSIRAGIVGLGYFGPNVLRNFAAQEECDMIWACDLSDARLNKTQLHYPSIKTTANYEDLLNDASLDLILIATPTSTHFPLASKALEAGKHVFIEKPMTGNAAEADVLNALAERMGKHIFIDHTFVFAPAVRTIKALAAQGDLGELLYFDSSRINLGLIQQDVNVLWDLAIHDLSILGTFKSLKDICTISCHGSRHFGTQEEDVHLHLGYDDNFTAHIHVSWLSPVKIRQSMLGGTKAMVLYDDTEPSEKLRIYDRGIDHDITRGTSATDPFFPKYRSGDIRIPALSTEETLATEAQHVLRCIQGTEKPIVSGIDGAMIVHILELADQSLKQGGLPVRVHTPTPIISSATEVYARALS